MEQMTNWLYGRAINLKSNDLVRFYSFANKRMMIGFQNALADVYRANRSKANKHCPLHRTLFLHGSGDSRPHPSMPCC